MIGCLSRVLVIWVCRLFGWCVSGGVPLLSSALLARTEYVYIRIPPRAYVTRRAYALYALSLGSWRGNGGLLVHTRALHTPGIAIGPISCGLDGNLHHNRPVAVPFQPILDSDRTEGPGNSTPSSFRR